MSRANTVLQERVWRLCDCEPRELRSLLYGKFGARTGEIRTQESLISVAALHHAIRASSGKRPITRRQPTVVSLNQVPFKSRCLSCVAPAGMAIVRQSYEDNPLSLGDDDTDSRLLL
jgi:hypothetical protein